MLCLGYDVFVCYIHSYDLFINILQSGFTGVGRNNDIASVPVKYGLFQLVSNYGKQMNMAWQHPVIYKLAVS